MIRLLWGIVLAAALVVSEGCTGTADERELYMASYVGLDRDAVVARLLKEIPGGNLDATGGDINRMKRNELGYVPDNIRVEAPIALPGVFRDAHAWVYRTTDSWIYDMQFDATGRVSSVIVSRHVN